MFKFNTLIAGRVVHWNSASILNRKFLHSDLTDVFGWALGLNLVTRLPVAFGSVLKKCSEKC